MPSARLAIGAANYRCGIILPCTHKTRQTVSALRGARVSLRAGTANRSNFRSGSNYDLRHRLALRLECDGEPTFGPERRLCGGDRT